MVFRFWVPAGFSGLQTPVRQRYKKKQTATIVAVCRDFIVSRILGADPVPRIRKRKGREF